jgi:hypothetical protein
MVIRGYMGLGIWKTKNATHFLFSLNLVKREMESIEEGHILEGEAESLTGSRTGVNYGAWVSV